MRPLRCQTASLPDRFVARLLRCQTASLPDRFVARPLCFQNDLVNGVTCMGGGRDE